MTDNTSSSRPGFLRAWRWVPSLYFAEGLPYVTILFIATVMYKCMDVSNARIALFTAWLSLPWVIKPLWSPFIDLFSTKRRWILAMQTALALAFAVVALAMPTPLYFNISMASFMAIAFLSATHDIAADGFYMLALDTRGQSWFVGIRTTFYRVAMIIGQGPLVILAGVLEGSFGVPHAWQAVFALLALIFLALAIAHSLTLPRPAADTRQHSSQLPPALILREFMHTFRTFFTKPHALSALMFMLLYRLPEAQLLKLISPFLLDSPQVGGLGLSTTAVGFVYGTVGVIGLLLGGVAGGFLVARHGLRRWFRPMAWSMSLTCLTFLYLSYAPAPSITIIYLCVFIEQAGYGFGCTAYTIFLMDYARGRNATSHYSIATGIMSLGIMIPGMAAGALQQWLGYRHFFIWTMICCIATIAVTYTAHLSDGDNEKKC